MPRAVRDFSSIYSTEQVTLSFDFSPALASGETILTSNSPPSPVVVVGVVYGIDPSPSSILIGTPSITGSGSIVMQSVGMCQPGVDYNLIVTVATTGGQKLTMNAHLSCGRIE